jgi:hypothetical protein
MGTTDYIKCRTNDLSMILISLSHNFSAGNASIARAEDKMIQISIHMKYEV